MKENLEPGLVYEVYRVLVPTRIAFEFQRRMNELNKEQEFQIQLQKDGMGYLDDKAYHHVT